MKVLVAPDKFKGSLSAAAAAAAIARGWQDAWPECEVTLAPIADGGEGFAEIFHQALGAEWVEVAAQDPLGRAGRGRATRGSRRSGPAILEMSEASGLWRLREDERAPLRRAHFRHRSDSCATRRSGERAGFSSGSAGARRRTAARAWRRRWAIAFLAEDGDGRSLPRRGELARAGPDRRGRGVSLPEVDRRVRCGESAARAARHGARLFPAKGRGRSRRWRRWSTR